MSTFLAGRQTDVNLLYSHMWKSFEGDERKEEDRERKRAEGGELLH